MTVSCFREFVALGFLVAAFWSVSDMGHGDRWGLGALTIASSFHGCVTGGSLPGNVSCDLVLKARKTWLRIVVVVCQIPS